MTALHDDAAAMGPRYPAGRYRWPARLLHWVMALIILTIIPIGLIMGELKGGPLQDWLFFLHEALGFCIVPLILVRLLYRLTHKPPPLPASIPWVQRLAAEIVHLALYALLLVQPVFGWLGANAYGAAVSIFGLFNLPTLLAKNEHLADQLFEVHENIGFIIGGLLVIHIGAAMVHGVVKKDGVVSRMWPP